MPKRITRNQALMRLHKEMEEGACIICHLTHNRKDLILHTGIHATALLSRYPRTWGQVMVFVHRHVTTLTGLEPAEWKEVTELVWKASKALESTLKPLRCYVAATGSSVPLPMTSPHFHFNIIPVYDEQDKPSSIFTWEQGLYSGTEEEWEELFRTLTTHF
jgi:diadenosine tetraphosphate (Ap4A) HIT family hydrolase